MLWFKIVFGLNNFQICLTFISLNVSDDGMNTTHKKIKLNRFENFIKKPKKKKKKKKKKKEIKPQYVHVYDTQLASMDSGLSVSMLTNNVFFKYVYIQSCTVDSKPSQKT